MLPKESGRDYPIFSVCARSLTIRGRSDCIISSCSLLKYFKVFTIEVAMLLKIGRELYHSIKFSMINY